MKLLCVLVSLFLCCSMIAFASPASDETPVPGDAPFGGFHGERPVMPIDGETSEGFPKDGSQFSRIPADGSFQSEGEFSQDGSHRPRFPGMGEGGFQPPQNGNFPAFGGRENPWQQSENQAEESGLSLFLKEYSIVPVSLGVLVVAFIFVGLYRRRHY